MLVTAKEAVVSLNGAWLEILTKGAINQAGPFAFATHSIFYVGVPIVWISAPSQLLVKKTISCQTLINI